MKPGEVKVPSSRLHEDLTRAAELAREAEALLVKLEASYLGHSVDKPGGWRQDPVAWMKRYRA